MNPLAKAQLLALEFLMFCIRWNLPIDEVLRNAETQKRDILNQNIKILSLERVIDDFDSLMPWTLTSDRVERYADYKASLERARQQ